MLLFGVIDTDGFDSTRHHRIGHERLVVVRDLRRLRHRPASSPSCARTTSSGATLRAAWNGIDEPPQA